MTALASGGMAARRPARSERSGLRQCRYEYSAMALAKSTPKITGIEIRLLIDGVFGCAAARRTLVTQEGDCCTSDAPRESPASVDGLSSSNVLQDRRVTQVCDLGQRGWGSR